jgi:hypothetical protein
LAEPVEELPRQWIDPDVLRCPMAGEEMLGQDESDSIVEWNDRVHLSNSTFRRLKTLKQVVEIKSRENASI